MLRHKCSQSPVNVVKSVIFDQEVKSMDKDDDRFGAATEFLECLLTDAFCTGIILTQTTDAIRQVVQGIAQAAIRLEEKRVNGRYHNSSHSAL